MSTHSAAAGRLTPEQRTALERGEVAALVRAGVLHPEPIVYEDFLPRSAAGIFASNLTDSGTMDADQGGAERDPGWMADVMGRTVDVPEEIYAQEASASLRAAEQILGRTTTSAVAPREMRNRPRSRVHGRFVHDTRGLRSKDR